MTSRPNNHVTRALDARLSAGPAVQWRTMPPVSDDFVAWLQENFSPRCKEPGEDLEAHLHYSGKVDLAATIRLNHEQAKREPADLMLDPDLDDDEIANVLLQRNDLQRSELLARQIAGGGPDDCGPGPEADN